MNGVKWFSRPTSMASLFYQKRYWKFIRKIIEVFLCLRRRLGKRLQNACTIETCSLAVLNCGVLLCDFCMTRQVSQTGDFRPNSVGCAEFSFHRNRFPFITGVDLESRPDFTCDMNLDFGSTCGYRFAILSCDRRRKLI